MENNVEGIMLIRVRSRLRKRGEEGNGESEVGRNTQERKEGGREYQELIMGDNNAPPHFSYCYWPQFSFINLSNVQRYIHTYVNK